MPGMNRAWLLSNLRYDLGIGTLSKRHLREAGRILHRASQTLLETTTADEKLCLDYSNPEGSPFYRKELATFLSKLYGGNVKSSNLMATAGAANTLALMTSHLVPPGSPVFVADPTYEVAVTSFSQAFRPFARADVDSEGVSVAHLRHLVASHREQMRPSPQFTPYTPFRGMVYLVPVFSNPTGATYSPERCRQLIKLAADHDLLVICDDVYNPLYHSDACPPRLLSYCISEQERNHVISNGSFSKLFAPGVRLGWIEASQENVDLAASKPSIACLNHYISQLMAMALKQGLVWEHWQNVRQHIKTNMRLAVDMLREQLPGIACFEEPQGGMFIWIRLPECLDVNKLLSHMETAHGITFYTGSACSASGKFESYLRISVASNEREDLKFAMETLCDVILQMYHDEQRQDQTHV